MAQNRFVRCAVGISALGFVTCFSAAYADDAPAPATQPAEQHVVTITAPTTQDGSPAPKIVMGPASQPSVAVSPAAKTELDAMSTAYGNLNSLELTGTLSVNFDVDGQKQQQSANFSSSFQSPNKFRHTMKDDAMLGCQGDKSYFYAADKKIYLMIDAPKTKVDFAAKPSDISMLVHQQNPSLFLALTDKPGDSLTQGASDVSKIDDTKVGDKSYSTLLIKSPTTDTKVLVDPQTHLIRQTQIDMSRDLKMHGAEKINAATATFDYTATVPNAAVKPEQFAWTPPADAKDAAQLKKEMMANDDAAANALVGKAAPAFELEGLDGKKIDIAKLKGNVVIIDFWATWCPPCRASLPYLDKLYQSKKDAGLKAFALDQAEEKDAVQKFVNDTKLGVPVLLDSDSKTGQAYGVNGIPQTVIIGKDGLVKKVIVGFSPDEVDGLAKAVETELAAK